MDLSKLFRTVVGTGFCRLITAAGTFALNLCLAWQLSLEDCGRVVLCLTMTIALAIFARFGFDGSLLKYGGAAWHAKDYLAFTQTSKRALLTVAIISSAITLLGQLILGLLGPNQWHGTPVMQALLWSLPFISMCYIVSSTFKAAHRPEAGALFEIGGACIVATLLLSLYSESNELTPVIAAKVFTSVAAVFCVSGMLLMRWLLWSSESDPGELQTTQQASSFLKEQARTSADFAVIAYGQVLGQWGSLLFLEIWYDEADVAVFNAAMRIVIIPNLVLNCVLAVCSPRISGLHGARDLAGMHLFVRRSASLLMLANLPILLITAVAAPWLMAYFGANYQPYWYLLSILACGQLVSTIVGMSTATLAMTGRHRVVRKIAVITAFSSFVLTGLLVWLLGTVGAAIGGAVYATTLATCIAVAARRHLGFFPTPTFHGLFAESEGLPQSQFKLGK